MKSISDLTSKVIGQAKGSSSNSITKEPIRSKILVPAPYPKEVSTNKLATLVGEICKSYGLSGFEPPDEDVLIARAQSIGEELPEIPHEWLPRVFTIARREYSPEPKIFHLLKSWREFVSVEYSRAKSCRLPKIIPPPEFSGEEKREALREMWVGLAARGISISEETLSRYEIKKSDIEEKKFEIFCPSK